MGWIEQLLGGHIVSYRIIILINGSFSNWEEVASGVPQKPVLGPVLFNIFINAIDQGVQGMLIKSVDDRKLGGIANILEERNKIQNYLDRLGHWAENNIIQFNCKVLYRVGREQMHSYKIYTTSEKDFGVVVNHKLNVSQQCDVATKTNAI